MSFMPRGSIVFHMGCNGEIRKKEPGNEMKSYFGIIMKWRFKLVQMKTRWSIGFDEAL